MQRKFFLWLPIFALFFFSTTHTYGEMRCGAHLIVLGASKKDVSRKCGEPDYIEEVSSAFESRTEEWYYDLGPASFPRVLTFEGYRLISIKTLSRQLN